MKIKEIVSTGYKLFNRMQEEKKLEQIEAVKYILMIASTSGINVMDWDLQEVFSAGKSANEIVTNRTDINRRFFTHNDELMSRVTDAAPISPELTEIAKNTLKDIGSRYIADIIAKAENDAQSRVRSAIDYMRNAENDLARAAVARLSVAHIRHEEFDIAAQVKTLHEGSFWEYIGQKTGYSQTIQLKTRNDVICAYKNQAAGINLQVNLGTFIAEFDMRNMRMNVRMDERNIMATDYYHPHISYDGGICWGNGRDAAANAISKLQLVQVFTLLASVLTNYNKDNPYKSLEEFAKIANVKINDANGEPIIPAIEMCQYCDRPMSGCVCEKCDQCGNYIDDCDCDYDEEGDGP